MGKNLKIAVASILALAIAACASEGEQSSNPTPTQTRAATEPQKTQPFNNPVVPAKQTAQVTVAIPNLIQPTNATERVGVVSKGRPDPFGQIVGQTTIPVSPNSSVTAKPIPVLPPLPTATKRIATPVVAVPVRVRVPVGRYPRQSRVIANNRTFLNQQKNRRNPGAIAFAKIPKTPRFTPVLPKVLPQVVANPTLVPVLPPPPQPELAKAVVVTGVLMVGKEPQAIIKVPNEPTSRYVQAGQRLANGVLIKRIEMNEGSEPVVIVEQYGIEVARMVGEASVNTSPTAATPVSVTTPPQNSVSAGAL